MTASRAMQLQLVSGPVLGPAEQELARCEAVIERGLSSFLQVGRELAVIRDRRLYKTAAGYASFDTYIQERWPHFESRKYPDRVIKATEVVKNLTPIGVRLPATETQARPLTVLNTEQQVEAWRRVVEAAGDHVITEALVKQAVREIQAEAAAVRIALPDPETPTDDAPEPEPEPPAPAPPASPGEEETVAVEPDPVEDDEVEAGESLVVVQAAPLIVVPAAPPEIADVYDVAAWDALPVADRRWIIEHAPIGRTTRFTRTNGNVEWALWTWNPVTGCDHGCDYCYARDIANRYYTELPEGQRFAPVFRPGRLHAPRHMRVPAAYNPSDPRTLGEKNVFTGSMTDLFGRWVPQEWIDGVFAEVVKAVDWNFLFLTKFPQRLAAQDWPKNAWVGTTVDRQARVATAERAFRGVTAGVKWLSCEPLLERLTFSSLAMFDWVVIGASSESTQTPEFQPPWEWVEHLMAQARAAGCKVYIKPNLKSRPREYPNEPTVPGRTVARLL